ncbi:MAG: hypothetical protein EU529_10315 [Promethearchaeota archaeon]|nr:MAG: hypothetical protein EU529_10315 [Candidatus Lokiarchaeota archaeon]
MVELVSRAAEGVDNFEKGAVGSNGYGFVFRNYDCGLPYVISIGSSKVFGAGSMRDFVKKVTKDLDKIESIEEFDNYLEYDKVYDMLLVGSVKTLVPTLEFGGHEQLFDVWMFVKTPEGRMFPATLYYGASGMSIGGWCSLKSIQKFYKEVNKEFTGPSDWDKDNMDETYFPKDLMDVINSSPFEFTHEEQNLFLDALEFALKKVPVSDFWGVYHHDEGSTHMGVSFGEPYMERLDWYAEYPEYEKKIEPYLNKKFIDAGGYPFIIRETPERKIYVIDELHKSKYNWFEDSRGAYRHILRHKVESVDIQIPRSLAKEMLIPMLKEGYTFYSRYITCLLLDQFGFSNEYFDEIRKKKKEEEKKWRDPNEKSKCPYCGKEFIRLGRHKRTCKERYA